MCHRRTRKSTTEASATDERTADEPNDRPASPGVVRTPVRALRKAVAAVLA